jgi:Domain of unknown function (DUF4249)
MKYPAGTNSVIWTALTLTAAIVFTRCVKPFTPPVIAADNSYLVVDGTILGNDTTTIKLSRTRNLSDTTLASPELQASVMVEDENGNMTALTDNSDGIYKTAAPFSAGAQYRLRIHTTNGKDYSSDLVELKKTPEIDSLHWEQNNDIFIYVNTHDPSNTTKYYRWNFTETSEYHSAYDSYLDFRGDSIVFLDPADYRYICYQDYQSDRIVVGTSAALSSDVISRQLITRIPNDYKKISVRYSILVRQFAISAAAYQYWKLLNQNNDETGGLFDPQPSQLTSNIHALQNPEEPVLGYLGASTITTKRLFIKENELQNRLPPSVPFCPQETLSEFDIPGIRLAILLKKLPAYGDTAIPLTVEVVPAGCVDCRLQGGHTKKPSFW